MRNMRLRDLYNYIQDKVCDGDDSIPVAAVHGGSGLSFGLIEIVRALKGSDKLDSDGNFKKGTFNILKKFKKN